MANDDSSVRVAVRIRPQVASEVIDMCRVCTRVTPGEPQVTLGQDKSFTFDQVFDTASAQLQIFETCVECLVGGALDGYNATVLAYGQTGSGKTYTMGTGFEVECNEETAGIIPRAIRLLFRGIDERVTAARAHTPPLIPPEFKVLAQFMELYNEEIIDLFDPARDHYGSKTVGGLRITEDGGGGVRVAGATCKPVRDAADALACLRLGALARTTAATNMNAASSRSHAVFTLHVRQQRLVRTEESDAEMDANGEPTNEFETLTAKFHFVDLAGSERLKRTGATGERAREGISINCGLLALGNVISALGDKSKKALHVPYRDSKLTRLLQDSLGGNSQTVMIACVSPSDRDFMETLNTLKYANRARNIKNKIVVNQDKSSRTISLLRQELAQLQLELLEFKQGKRILIENGEDGINDLDHENRVLQSELDSLRARVKAMQGTIEQLSKKNTELLSERALGQWVRSDAGDDTALSECGLTTLIQGYVQEIEGLRAQLLEANNMYDILKRNTAQRQQQQQQHGMSRSFVLSPDASLLDSSSSVLHEAKKKLYMEKELLARSMGELEFQRKMSQSTASAAGEADADGMGERERAEGESADDTDHSEEASDSESESEDSESKVCAELGAELANLSGDIDMKQRLVEELELSQRRLHSLQRHYEDKLLALHHQIKLTQEERDKVMQSYNSQVSPPSEKMKRVREEYERKLSEMSRELRRLQSAQREHGKLLRSHANTEHQIQSVRNELQEMKRNKVKLLNKMKEESARHKAAEARRAREVAQLRKESRKNANVIRNLENERRLKEQVLKRKQEEVSLLRRGHRDKLSNMAAGRVKRERVVRKSAAHKWAALEKALVRATLNRQVIGELECDMERQIAERERLSREREALRRRAAAPGAPADLTSELDSLQANIAYLHETIAEAQQQIMQIEEAKESGGGEEAELSALVAQVEGGESGFVLDKLVALVLQHSYTAARQHKLLQDTQAKLHQMEVENERTESALRLAAVAGGDYNLNYSTPGSPLSGPAATLPPPPNHQHISSGTSTRSVSPVDSTLIELRNDAKKLSRLANGSQGDMSPGERPSPFQRSSNVRGSVRLREIGVYGSTERAEDPMTQSMLVEPTHRGQPLARVPSAPGSLKGLTPVSARAAASPLPARKSYSPAHTPLYSPAEVPASPRLQRRLQPLMAKPASMEAATGAGAEWEAPGSPAAARRARDDDVFCRLTTTTASAEHPLGGVVKEYQGKWRGGALQCTHVAEGHVGAVLALAAHQRTLYSGGVDRTVRVWDLGAGREVTCVAGHAHAVVCVRAEPRSGLLFSVAGAAVRLSDTRQDPMRPVKTFWSSGVTGGSGGGAAGGARGEVAITDAALNPSATTLYTAVNDKLRLWDLRKFECSGKISTGHQAAVMCLAVGSTPAGDDLVVTGSKDHYVRTLEARGAGGAGAGAGGARTLLEPPHYDGVQSLALAPGGAALYTGSRDMSVKRWNLDTNELVHSVNGAHKGWVTGVVARADGAVASCGRGGRLRVWDAALRPLGDAHADDAVHALALHHHVLYTAGNGGEVRMWRWSAEQ